MKRAVTRYATVRTASGTAGALVEGDEFVVLPYQDAAAAAAAPVAGDVVDRLAWDEVRLAPPVVAPSKIVCVGLNYASHIREMGRELPTHPTLFAKFARSLIGPRDEIRLPRVSRETDWEAELAVVVGRTVRDATPAEAREAIAGYTVFNDVSIRDYQWRTPQWLAGKTFEATTPVGPVLVTPDEVDHARDLRITCDVDGEVMQSSRTSDLVFRPEDIISYVSEIITLDPGDLIATGTPGGVGAARDPKVFLRAGQTVRTAVEGIGELVNVCVEG